MAYGQGWDASTPDGAITPAADIDEEIQNLKVALGERLVQVMPEWADDLKDPKKLSIVYGDLASRPAAPDFAGEMYFAEDNATLYIGNAALEWVAIGGTIEAPPPGTDPISQTYYVAANKGANQAIGGSSTTALSGWVVASSFGTWYSGGQPTRLTCPAGGSYELYASVAVENVNLCRLQFKVNGTSGVAAATRFQPHGGPANASIQGAFQLVAGDYVELFMTTEVSIPSINVLGTYSHVKITRHP